MFAFIYSERLVARLPSAWNIFQRLHTPKGKPDQWTSSRAEQIAVSVTIFLIALIVLLIYKQHVVH